MHPTLSSNNIQTPNPTAPVPRQRLTKIKLTDNSFRLGQGLAVSISAPSGKQREFRFYVPSVTELGNGEEAIKIYAVANALNESTIGLVTKLSVNQATWIIHLQLSPSNEVENEDQYLSDISRQLDPIVNQLQDLKAGFQRGKSSSWKYCINDFVAAEDNL